MQNDTLTSLAMLRVQVDRGADYFDYLIPFVSHALSKREAKTFIPEDIQSELLHEFGINIPQHSLTKILRRISKRTKAISIKDGVFHIEKTIHSAGFEEDRAKARQRQALVIKKLISFAKTRCKLDWDEAKCQSAILQFLRSFSVECLKAYSAGSALPTIQESASSSDYVVSAFLRDSYDSSTEVFESFLVILRGNMLANALLCDDLQSLEKKYDNVTFYLDTPFIMHLLGFWGEPAKRASGELLHLLKSLNGKIAIFNHTVDETRNVLRHAAAELEKATHVPHIMVRSLRRDGYRPVDLWTLEQQLPEFFSSRLIRVEPAPPYIDKYNIGETDLRDVIEDEIPSIIDSYLKK